MCTIYIYYSGDIKSNARDLLFKYANETIIRRKGEGKVKADLIDMIVLLRKVYERKESLPQFLADGFSSMPPASGFETIAEHIINLTTVLKNEIESLENKYITEDKLTDIKEDIFDIKSILMQKVTSGEPCIPTTRLRANKTKRLYADVASSSTSSKKDESDVSFALTTSVIKDSDSADEKNCDVGGEKNKFMSGDNGNRKRSNFNKGNTKQRTAKRQPHEQDAAGSKREMEDKENNWQVHQSKKKRKEVIRGSKRVNCSFKGTMLAIVIYI